MTQLVARERTRRPVLRWLLPALVMIAVVITAVGIPIKIAEDKYGPVDFGGTGGTFGPGVVDSGGDRLLAPEKGPAYVLTSMRNDGSHSVVVTDIERSEVITDARWASYPDDATPVDALRWRWHRFPVTITDKIIMIRLTIRAPDYCEGRSVNPDGGSYFDGDFRARWESLLHDHTTTVFTGLSDGADGDIKLC